MKQEADEAYQQALDRLARLRQYHGDGNVETRPGEGAWAGCTVVYVRSKPDVPWRFSGHAYREPSCQAT